MRGGMPKKTVCPLSSVAGCSKKASCSEEEGHSLRESVLLSQSNHAVTPEPTPKETSRWDNINPKLDYCTHAATPLHRYISKLHCLGYYVFFWKPIAVIEP